MAYLNYAERPSYTYSRPTHQRLGDSSVTGNRPPAPEAPSGSTGAHATGLTTASGSALLTPHLYLEAIKSRESIIGAVPKITEEPSVKYQSIFTIYTEALTGITRLPALPEIGHLFIEDAKHFLNSNVWNISDVSLVPQAYLADFYTLFPVTPNCLLAREICKVLKNANVDDDVQAFVDVAVSEAVKFVNAHLSTESPRVMISDDGILTLQWRSDRIGVMLMFGGDGTAEYSIRRPGGSYSADPHEFHLADGLPDTLHTAISQASLG